MGSVKLKSRDYVSKPLGDGAQRKKAKVEAKLTQNTKKKKKKNRPEAETGEEESWTAYKFPEACVL